MSFSLFGKDLFQKGVTIEFAVLIFGYLDNIWAKSFFGLLSMSEVSLGESTFQTSLAAPEKPEIYILHCAEASETGLCRQREIQVPDVRYINFASVILLYVIRGDFFGKFFLLEQNTVHRAGKSNRKVAAFSRCIPVLIVDCQERGILEKNEPGRDLISRFFR